MISEHFEQNLILGFLGAVEHETDHYIQEHKGKSRFTIFPQPEEEQWTNYSLIEDLNDFKSFDGLEALVDKLFAEFSDQDHLFVMTDGALLKNVRFYIARGLSTLAEAQEWKNVVGLEHILYSSSNPDEFQINTENGQVFFVPNIKK